MPSPCNTCNKPAATAVCSACKCTYYCNAKCQRKDWKTHKMKCQPLILPSLPFSRLRRIPTYTVFHGIRTNIILNGYIRIVALPLLLINELPEAIETVILLYIGKYFKYYGKYSHIIEKALVNKVINADRIACKMFNIASFDWELEIFPNGNNKANIGSLDLFLKLLTETDNKLLARWTVSCAELKSSHTHIDIWHEKDCLGWPYGTLSTQELKDNMNTLHSLTFNVEVQILRIFNKENDILYQQEVYFDLPFKKQAFEWNIMDLNNVYVCKQFESEIYNSMWLLQCIPNNEGNDFDITLVLCSLPKEISYINVNLEIDCDGIDIHYKDEESFDLVKNCDLCWNEETLILSFDEFRKYNMESLLVKVNIEILELYHNDGYMIPEREWGRYIIEYERNDMNRIDFTKQVETEIYRNNRYVGNEIISQINQLLAVFDRW